MCKKLFNDKDCCIDCFFKYVPFGKSRERLNYSDEEAIKHHKKIDDFYKTPDYFGNLLINRIKNHKDEE